MSQGPNKPPQQIPSATELKPADTWQNKLMPLAVLIFGMFSAYMSGKQPAPTPAPTPAPIIIEDKSKPAPVPDVIPAPSADDPAANITITDSNGQPINGLVKPGQQLIISGAKSVYGSLLWSVEPQSQQFITPENTTVVYTTPNEFTTIRIQLVAAKGDKIASKTVLLQYNGTPKPDDKTSPAPIQKGKVSISIVENPQNRTLATAQFLESIATWNSLMDSGSTYRFISTSETTASAEAAKAILGTAIPGWIIKDSAGNVVLKGPLPTDGSERTIVQQFTGNL